MSRGDPAKKIILYRYADDGGVVEIQLPTHKVVCPSCRGTGRHVNPNIDGNGITASEMDELGDDFREDYFNGVYDVQCQTCNGANVVDELDEDRCPPDQLKDYLEQEAESAHCDAIQRAEQRAECWAAGERW